ncbi:MAG: hypothetical protein ABJA18_09020 [bacterium]
MPGWFKKRPDTPARVSTDTSPKGVYSGLRQQALSANRTDVGIAAPSPEAPAWGILMETGYDAVTVTLVALSDGTTSLYFSNGGGVIGGHDHEAVRHANGAFLIQANDSLSHLMPCETFPIPEAAQTIFYVLTDSGILKGGAPENDLGNGRHPLSTLFHAGHEVISQLRLISEADA